VIIVRPMLGLKTDELFTLCCAFYHKILIFVRGTKPLAPSLLQNY